MTKRTFTEWASLLSSERVRGEESVVQFHWKLEDEYDARFNEAILYFDERPDLIGQECIEHLIELNELESRFLSTEDYEKCAAVRDLRLALNCRYEQYIGAARFTP